MLDRDQQQAGDGFFGGIETVAMMRSRHAARIVEPILRGDPFVVGFQMNGFHKILGTLRFHAARSKGRGRFWRSTCVRNCTVALKVSYDRPRTGSRVSPGDKN